jgi:hypothetical protein
MYPLCNKADKPATPTTNPKSSGIPSFLTTSGRTICLEVDIIERVRDSCNLDPSQSFVQMRPYEQTNVAYETFGAARHVYRRFNAFCQTP